MLDNIEIKSLMELKGLPLTIGINLDGDGGMAEGQLILDDGMTLNSSEVNEYYFNATGSKPFFGKGKMSLNCTTVARNSKREADKDELIFDFIIYSASNLGFNEKSHGRVFLNTE